LTHSISKDQLKFPEDCEKKCSRPGMQALKALLERDPSKRLACKSREDGFEEIQSHPWFESMDWSTLETKEQIPPFVPDPKKANFDASHELEELLLEDNPLKAKQRKVNQDNLSTEMKQMEDQFTPYDFKKMHRRSYYPHNQQIVSTVTATDSTGALVASRPVTPGTNDQRSDRAMIRPGGAADFDLSDSLPSPEKVISEKDNF